MTTDVQTAEKFLAYDGDCPMCIATVGLLIRWGLVRQEQTHANHDLDAADAELARQAGIRNQLVVIDPVTRQTRVGSDGLLWIVGETAGYRSLTRLFSLPGFRQLLNFGYQAVSYNRRIISPPAQQIVCDCEPQVTVFRRLTLMVPLAVLSVLIMAGFGAAVFVGCGLGDPLAGVVLMEVASGVGWLIAGTAGATLLRGMRGLDYVGHLVVTMFAGSLVLLPGAMVLAFLPRPAAVALAVLSLMFSCSTMFKMQVRRVTRQSLSYFWLWGWALVMLAGFGSTLATFFRQQLP